MMKSSIINSLPPSLYSERWLTMKDWRSHWVDKIFNEANRLRRSPGWNPKIVPLDGDLVMVDLCFHPHLNRVQLPHSILVVEHVDHPFLAELPANAPRAVKSLYKKQVRMKHLRSQEAWTYVEDEKKAAAAWEKFISPHSAAGVQ